MQGPSARVLPARRQSSFVAVLLSSPQVAQVFLSARAFTVVWLCVVGSHFVLGTSKLAVAATHLMLADPAACASFTLMQILRNVVLATGWSMIGVAGLHSLSLGLIIRDSIRAKRLTFFHRQTPRKTLSGPVRADMTKTIWQYVKMPVQVVAAVFDRVFGVDGLVGIHGPFFFLFFNVLEALEVVSQGFQAHQLSRYGHAPFLNALLVAAVFASCTAHPLVLFLNRRVKKRSMQRLAVVAADLVIDLMYAEVIPGLVLLSIVREFDVQLHAFPPTLSFNDFWTNNAVAQARFVLVTSYVDLASTLVPHLNFILGIHTFKDWLHHRADARRVADVALMPLGAKTEHASPWSGRRSSILAERWSRVFHCCLFACGEVVVAFHVDAQWHNQSPMYGCKLPLTPCRFGSSDTVPCGVLYLNCHHGWIQGHTTEIDAVLGRVDISLLSSLILAHCPALEMPPIFTQISRLAGL